MTDGVDGDRIRWQRIDGEVWCPIADVVTQLLTVADQTQGDVEADVVRWVARALSAALDV